MKEIISDIWKYNRDNYIVITTNGYIKKDGSCVMGRGVALQAAQRYVNLSMELGAMIENFGNQVFIFPTFNIITFPVKHNWRENADLKLIEISCKQLVRIVDVFYKLIIPPVYLVRPGVGDGKLNWTIVKPILKKYLNDDYIVVNKVSP